MNETVINLVDAIKSGDVVSTETAFAAAMAEKLADRIDTLRQEVAKDMFANETVTDEFEEIEEGVEQIDEYGDDFKNHPKPQNSTPKPIGKSGTPSSFDKSKLKPASQIKPIAPSIKAEETVEEGITKKVGDFLNKGADEIGDAGNAVGSLVGKAIGGVAKTVGAIRQTPAAIGTAYNTGRAGTQKAIAK
jgi:HAMP domain-containing protein